MQSKPLENMAKSIIMKMPSKEMEHFSRDLFNYIWEKHRGISRCFDEALNEMLKDDKEHSNESEVISPFNEDIGDAVLFSQYLLRDYCCFNFKCYLKHQETAFNCICAIVHDWMKCRTDVFHKFVDCAAIVAEAFLYCSVELNEKIVLSSAPTIFMVIFYKLANLEGQFFGNGGWKRLKERAFDDYIYFKVRLAPFVYLGIIKYHRLDYNCELIELLFNSPVFYPVETSKICDNCLLPSKTKLFRATIMPVNSKQDSGGNPSKDISPQEGFSKDDPSDENALSDSMSKCQITQSHKKVLDKQVEIFSFRLGVNAEDVDKAVNMESKAEKSSKKKRKTKS